MKKILFIFSCLLLLANSCGQNETIGDPSFHLNLVVSNPAQSFKLSLNICRQPSSERNGLIYIQRVQENSMIPDYRENGVVRRQMLDTMPLDQKAFEKFSFLIKKARVWEQGNSIGERTDGNVYHFTVKDSLREHTFSLMGMTDNKYLQELAAFCLDQFKLHYPQIPLLDINSEIDLKKYDRLTDKVDSVHIQIIKYGNTITVFQDQRSYTLTKKQFIELWRILESNHIWNLDAMTEFATKYPVEYRLSLRRDNLSRSFIVYAPSKLQDKRYFNVINCIETLKLSDTDENDISK